jgi:hypothetical protein
MEGIICAEKGSQTAAGIVGLSPAFWCQFHAVVGNGLVDVAVFWGV